MEAMSKTQKVPPANIKKFSAGDFLFYEGDPSKCMYLIQKGAISIRKYKGAAYVELARLYSNEVLGELSFFDRLPRSAAAVAITEVEAVELQFDALDKILSDIPEYMKTIISGVADRLRRANDTIRRLEKKVVSDTKDNEVLVEDHGDVPSDIPATSPPPPKAESEPKSDS